MGLAETIMSEELQEQMDDQPAADETAPEKAAPASGKSTEANAAAFAQAEADDAETLDSDSDEFDDKDAALDGELDDDLDAFDLKESKPAAAELNLEPGDSDEAEEPAAADEAPVEEGPNWFVIHCYSGYENKVRHNLEQRIDTMGMKGKIFDVVVPTEEEIEVREGKRRTVERRVFPGYILVQMVMDEDSWYVVRNTPGVTGFVGMGNTPTPLRPEEVNQIMKRMEAESPKVKVTFSREERVKVVDGPFTDFIGVVDDIHPEKGKVRVLVSFFGRETPVELDFLQVARIT